MNYELICIFSPKITEKDLEKGTNKILDLLKELKAEKIESNSWGKKTLGYEINKFTDGYYIQYSFEIESDGLKELNKKLKLEDQIIRFLVVREKEYSDMRDLSQEKKEEPKKDSSSADRKIKNNNAKSKDFDKALEEVLGKDITD